MFERILVQIVIAQLVVTAAFADEITIFADQDLGEFVLRHGFLHGDLDVDFLLDDSLIADVKPRFWRLSEDVTFDRAVLHNARVSYMLGDAYLRAGLPNPWLDWEQYEASIRADVRRIRDRWGLDSVDVWDIWNEPDNAFFWPGNYDQLLETFARTANAVRSVHPSARFVGPSVAVFRPSDGGASDVVGFLVDLDQLYGIRLDVISWHENGTHLPELIPGHAEQIRAGIEANFPPEYQPPFHVNEYLGPHEAFSPGVNVGYLHYLELADIDAWMRACWQPVESVEDGQTASWDSCNYGLGGLLSRDGQTPGVAYWVHKAYADMEGELRLVTSGSRTKTNALASRNDASETLQIFLGRYYDPCPADVTIRVEGYPYSHLDVQVQVKLIPQLSGIFEFPIRFVPLPGGPIDVSNTRVPVLDGSFDIVLDDVNQGEAYIVLVSQQPCTDNAECNDGVFCNGEETCVQTQCQRAIPPSCGDDVDCTDDSCDPGTDACEHVPNDILCGNNNPCDGIETCDAESGSCMPGTITDCNGNEVDDSCDLDQCVGSMACRDCNGNGVPDGCDLAAGEPDKNANGVPDICEQTCAGENAECDDVNQCTFDQCINGFCENSSAPYGDVAGPGGACGSDDTVDLSDILAVLNGFQGQYAEGCELLNIDIAGSQGSCAPNGKIDLSDILGVLDAFQSASSCCSIRPGACCTVGGCNNGILETSCTAGGGDFQGVDTNCGAVDCSPFGACCTEGVCTDSIAPSDCTVAGGEYQGDATDCGTLDCPVVGACCTTGDCANDVTPTDCTTAGGEYQGDGTDCAAIECPPVRAEFEVECGLPITVLRFVSCELIVPDDGDIITDLNVGLFITHTYQGDLTISLLHNDTGTVVRLIETAGLCSHPFGYDSDDFGTPDDPLILDDEAATPIDCYGCGEGIDGYSGPAYPAGSLSAFNGENKGGAWTLRVFDPVSQDDGVLESFSLRFLTRIDASSRAPTIPDTRSGSER